MSLGERPDSYCTVSTDMNGEHLSKFMWHATSDMSYHNLEDQSEYIGGIWGCVGSWCREMCETQTPKRGAEKLLQYGGPSPFL